ncbi:Uncharacterized protein Rs2_50578 [Raphanus sativus]|nr:Uncharacterized protein Rs2_50578 [Raphanus sativus]
MFFSSARDLESEIAAADDSDLVDAEVVEEAGADELVDDLPPPLAAASAAALRWALSSCSRRSSSRSFCSFFCSISDQSLASADPSEAFFNRIERRRGLGGSIGREID